MSFMDKSAGAGLAVGLVCGFFAGVLASFIAWKFFLRKRYRAYQVRASIRREARWNPTPREVYDIPQRTLLFKFKGTHLQCKAINTSILMPVFDSLLRSFQPGRAQLRPQQRTQSAQLASLSRSSSPH